MSTELHETESAAAEPYQHYRALSTAAVASLIVGLLSAAALLEWVLIAIPLIGVLLGGYAWRKVKRHSDELSGEPIARWGFLLSAFFLVAGPARLTYEFMTEVPDGYERVSYAELQPDPAQAGQIVPPAAMALEGKKVFIKGFVYPGQAKYGIQQFLLVRDQGDCCFGGNPRITDRIQVKLVDTKRFNFETRMFKVAGTFHVEPHESAIDNAKGGVLYHLEADHLE